MCRGCCRVWGLCGECGGVCPWECAVYVEGHEGTGVWGKCMSVGVVSGVCLWAGVLGSFLDTQLIYYIKLYFNVL